MKTKFEDTLEQSLDLPPKEDEEANTDVTVYHGDDKDKSDFDNDYEMVRHNLREMVNDGNDTLKLLARVAETEQTARMYEVLGSFISHLTKANKDLIDLHKQKSDITGKKQENSEEDDNKGGGNNYFIGSTEELQRAIEESKKKNNG